MTEKIVDLFFPIDKETILKELVALPAEVAQEYVDGLGGCIEEMLLLRNVVSLSNRPQLAKHLIEDLPEHLLGRLPTIIIQLKRDVCDSMITAIVNATWGITKPTPESEMMADELVSLIKAMGIDHAEESKEIADWVRLLKIMSSLLITCNMGDEIETLVRNRLTMLPEDDLKMLLKIGYRKVKSN